MYTRTQPQPHATHAHTSATHSHTHTTHAQVGAGTVIEGLDMIITKMSLGTKVSVVFPPALAYGDDGLPPKVPPNTPVHLIVELISFFDDQDSDDRGGEDED